MLTATKGVLVLCDPSIKAIISQINTEHEIIINDLDESHILIKLDCVEYVKNELNKILSKNVYTQIE